jgi:hypothetical protein
MERRLARKLEHGEEKENRLLGRARHCSHSRGRGGRGQGQVRIGAMASDPAKRHSAAITDGPDRAGARSMLKAVGFTDEDLARPLIGVATTWIETMPCNLNQRELAQDVKRGVRDSSSVAPTSTQFSSPAMTALCPRFDALP